ncbi:PLDc N-terminal domain-containing protein [Desulfovibrio sp. OttesenSCG-928-C06]|nr:PLDc N-terminal domain-containing protein [Desulfovibrio sp. OttesenSCG-928-C06]
MLQALASVYPSVPLWLKIAALSLPILPNLWCIFQAGTKPFKVPAEKFLWLGAGVFLPVLGGLLFLVFGRGRIARSGD